MPSVLTALLLETLPAMARFLVGIWLFTAPLPLREDPPWKRAGFLLVLDLYYLLLSLLPMHMVGTGSILLFSLAQFATYSLLLLGCVGVMYALYDCSIWTALFCCSAGYTLQNFVSGTVELVWYLLGGSDALDPAYHSPAFYAISIVCPLVIYGLVYLLQTRNLRRHGLMRVEDRKMLLMMAVTILVIIGFDLIVKWLASVGTSKVAVVLLRLFHGGACAFTLWMELQLLITRRAEAERDVMEQVLAERGRQYTQARENVEAINARVHSIRHSLARMADAGGVDRALMADMVREVAVYDARSNSGNEALDTALSEMRLMYAGRGIVLTCVADGTALGFIAPADIYVMFCAMLDSIADAGASSVSLVVRETLGTASVHLESNGSAPDPRALGIIETIVSRYKGTLATSELDGSFDLDLLFPAQ